MEKDEKKPAVDATTTTPASAGESNKEIDYKAEAESLRTQLKKAEHTIVEEKEKNKPASPVEVDIDHITETVKKSLEEGFDKKLESARLEFAKDVLEAELERSSSNADERELIKLHYENSIRKTGFDRSSILRDIANAKALANSKKLENTLKEVRAATLSDKTKATGSSSSQFIETNNVTLTPAEEKWVASVVSGTGKKREDIVAKLMANRAQRR